MGDLASIEAESYAHSRRLVQSAAALRVYNRKSGSWPALYVQAQWAAFCALSSVLEESKRG
jgi:hypothetical protein